MKKKTEENIKIKKTKTKKNKKETVTKTSYLKEVRKEMKKVSWPTKKEVFKYSMATIVFCLFFAGFFQILNLVLSVIKGMFA